MPGNELRALGDLAVDTLDITITTPTQGLHEAVAERVFRAVGPGSAPTRIVHDGIASSVYAAVRAGSAALVSLAGAAAEAAGHGDARVLDRSRAGTVARAALNALVGDRLEERGSEVRIEMSVRAQGADVALEPAVLAGAFPAATPRLAVFLHGLGEDEDTWRLRSGPQGGATYGSRLAAELAYTPLYVRYNTGLHVSENGRRLARLLDALVEAWPVPVEEIALIGHSMGGLVARSACHASWPDRPRWTKALRHVVFLGSPHLGAPLEKLVNLGSWALGRVPETRPLAGVLNTRSVGIKDLRFGYICDDDWRACDADELLRNTRSRLAEVEGVSHHYVAATLTGEREHPLGRIAGDLLVRYRSATGHGIAASPERTRHFGGLDHFDLLNDPEVYAHLRACLAGDRGDPAHPSEG